MSILNNLEVRNLYDRMADSYDTWLTGFRLLGLGRWRSRLINELKLSTGDTVVDLCCGGGQNFELLQDAIGPDGHIIGIDLSAGMLAKAQAEAVRLGIRDIELIQGDVGDYELSPGIDGVISTFGLEMVPSYPQIIERVNTNLNENGRLGLLGLKYPTRWPDWLVDLGEALVRRFGATRDYQDFQPWRSVEATMRTISFREYAFGAAYACVADRRSNAVQSPG